MTRTKLLPALALAATLTVLLAGCGSDDDTSDQAGSGDKRVKTLNIDFATYNPLSLVIKDQGWLEKALPDTKVNWVQSAGSNKANENLRAGAIDVGSTAGSAALLFRSNGSPIKTIDIFSQPDWAAIVVAKGSPIKNVEELKGKKVAATKGTDPYFFLLQSLAKAGLKQKDVTVENLQHADGRVALENGSVDAWSGLDPIMAASEATAGSRLIYRNVDFNTYGFLNATESFLSKDPATAQTVVNAYEYARGWAKKHKDETADILAKVAGIDAAVAKTTLARTNLKVDPVPGAKQEDVLKKVGPIFVSSGDVDKQSDIDTALDSLFAPDYATKADPAQIKADVTPGPEETSSPEATPES